MPVRPMVLGLSCAREAHGVRSELERPPSRLALSQCPLRSPARLEIPGNSGHTAQTLPVTERVPWEVTQQGL